MSSDLDAPRRLHALVIKYPGIHLRELARESGLSEAHALYHVQRLLERGILSETTDGVYRRYYSRQGETPAPADRELLAVLRRRIPLQIALLLLERKTLGFQDVVRELSLAKSTVSYHLNNLEAEGLLRRDEAAGTYALSDPATVERILLQWRPTEDVTERFARLWSGFYRRSRHKP